MPLPHIFAYLEGAPRERPSQLRVLGVPVRVELTFLLMAGLFGVQGGALGVVVAMAVISASLLAHEFAHAAIARSLGCEPRIVLRAYGGVTLGVDHLQRGRLLLAALAGPTLSLAVGAISWSLASHSSQFPLLQTLLKIVFRVNCGWAMVSLLPTRPFDGGDIVRAVLGNHRRVLAGVVALAALAAAGLSLLLLRWDSWAVVACAVAMVGAASELVTAMRERHDQRMGLVGRIDDVDAMLDAGEVERAHQAVDNVLRGARSQALRDRAQKLLMLVHIARRDPRAASRAFAALPYESVIDAESFAALQELLGRVVNARLLLEQAQRVGQLHRRGAKLLIDLLARDGDLRGAVTIATQCATLLSEDDLRNVTDAAEAGGLDVTGLRALTRPR